MNRVIVETKEEPYEVTNWTKDHRWTADEPESAGGEGKGPNPYDYLLGALGSCTAMTVRMYCERKDWPLEEVRVNLEIEESHREDCQECEDEFRTITEIDIQINVRGDLSDEQHQRIHEIARKCPVRRTLQGEINIRETEVRDLK